MTTPRPTEDTTMTDLTPEQRARALELCNAYVRGIGPADPAASIGDTSVRGYLAVEAHVLASHTCPDVEGDDYPEPACLIHDISGEDVRGWEMAECTCPESDPGAKSRLRAWDAVAGHPFFADCYQAEGTLVEAMLAKLDDAHNHACEPVWRPTTAKEVQKGWEVRARRRDGSEAGWGVAHHQDGDGDWLTEAGDVLTYISEGWTYETTAPEPEPWPEGLVEDLRNELGALGQYDASEADALSILNGLAAAFPGVRAAIAEGE